MVAPKPDCVQHSVLVWHSSAPRSQPPLMLSPLPPFMSHFKAFFGNVPCHIYINTLIALCKHLAVEGQMRHCTDPQQSLVLPASLQPLNVHARHDTRTSEMVPPSIFFGSTRSWSLPASAVQIRSWENAGLWVMVVGGEGSNLPVLARMGIRCSQKDGG